MAANGSTWTGSGRRKGGKVSSAKSRRKIYLRSANLFNPTVYDRKRKQTKRYRETPDLPF